jgi:hypothetical protein
LLISSISISSYKLSEELRTEVIGWSETKLNNIARITFGFDTGSDHQELLNCYATDAVMITPLNVPSGLVQGATNIVHQTVSTRSLVSDVNFIVQSTALSTHTIEKDQTAIVATVGRFVHTGTDQNDIQCEVETPAHIFQEFNSNYQIISEWQILNYTEYVNNIKSCNTLTIPLGTQAALAIINQVYPDIIAYGWNGTELLNLINRFWYDFNSDTEHLHEDTTVELFPLIHTLATIMGEAGIKTVPTTPNKPSIVINAKSEEWTTISVLVAQEIIGIDVQTGSPCSFQMEYVHAYVIQRHFRLAGFATAGNSNQLKLRLENCNKFGTKEYGYNNWKNSQNAMTDIMENLRRNRILEQICSGTVTIDYNALNKSITVNAHRPSNQDSHASESDSSEGEEDNCLCNSAVGCALHSSKKCCPGLTCHGDTHHSECIPHDRKHYENKFRNERKRSRHNNHERPNPKSCILSEQTGCDHKHPCCSQHAHCLRDRHNRTMCRLKCDLY